MAPATKHSSAANTTFAIAASGLVAASTAILLLQRRRRRKQQQPNDLLSTSRDLLLFNDDDEQQQQQQEECIYLDYNGTTPVHPQVVEATVPYLRQHFGNPSSGHAYGDVPARALETARRQILRELLGAAAVASTNGEEEDDADAASSIVFTACGTESDNLAIHWALQNHHRRRASNNSNNSSQPAHVVTCNVEHPAVEACLNERARRGAVEVACVPVGTDGRVTASDVIAAIRSDTALVTLMLANNETGALQPVKQVAEHCRRKGILFHTDAAQAAGKVSCRLDDLGHPDLITLVGHKIGAPKGVACLYVRPGCLDFSENDGGDGHHHHLTGLLVGGGQERGRRAGTENVPYIAGFGKAAELCARHLTNNAAHMEVLRHRLLTRLRDGLDDDGVRVHGPTDPAHRLPNTLSVGFGGGIHSGTLLAAVRTRVAASAGAACHGADGPVSATLRAMQVPDDCARATVRLSLGPKTTTDQVDRAAAILVDEIKRQRREQQQQQQQQKTTAASETANGMDSQ